MPSSVAAKSMNSRMLCCSPVAITSPAIALQHQPLRLDIVARVAPVAPGVEISQVQESLKAELDARQGARDLARHERLAAYGRLVVEQDAVAGENPVRLAIVDGDPVRVELGDCVGETRIERASVSRCGVSWTLPKSSEVDAW